MEVRCFVAYPVRDSWTAPVLVSLETAAYLRARGWWVLVDPMDERLADILAVYRLDQDRHAP